MLDGLADGILVAVELVADRGPDEVGAVGIEALLDQEVDMAQVDVTQVDRQLLAIRRGHSSPPHTIHVDGMWRAIKKIQEVRTGEDRVRCFG
ncbi:Uncharacterized protein APZ42_003156 [Daphnia magna]|uniref:Uncharacterized protein n=1 Tax=Daphnia magna TaxID=35525 RepID=A0A164HSC0_9CRUS|nr:Uncharacterized protein APZ42_003156 [Daphnia magna]